MAKKDYDVYRYWNKRIEPASAPEDYTRETINYIEKHLDDCKYILDFGAGIGRTFPAYNNIDKVIACDISTLYSERILEESKKYPFEFELNIINFMDKLPYEDKQFDAVVCSTVLLHQMPDDLVFIMSELVRVGKKVIVISKYDVNLPFDEIWQPVENKRRYNFNYDYYKICRECKFTMKDPVQYKRNLFFVMMA